MRIPIPLSLLLALGFGASLHAQDMDEPHRVVEVFRTVDAQLRSGAPAPHCVVARLGGPRPGLPSGAPAPFDQRRERADEERHPRRRAKDWGAGAPALSPLDPDTSYAVYSVEDLGDGTSRAGYTFYMRTKPGSAAGPSLREPPIASLGGLAAGSFEKSLNETPIGLEHYLTSRRTGVGAPALSKRVTGGSDNAEAVLKEAKATGTYDDYEGSVRKVKA